MNVDKLKELVALDRGDYGDIDALEFESIVVNRLTPHGLVKRQVKVPNRGDGRRGRIDLVFTYENDKYAIEIDRTSPRAKSIFKVRNYNKNPGFIILRSPIEFIEI